MELWQLILIVGTLLAATVSFIWSATKISYFHKQGIQPKNAASDAINQGIAQAFTEEFRDELRQRARVKFDQIMQENSMLLQQDVRVSVSRVNEFMKNEILSALQQEMAKHQESVSQTKQMFNETVTKSQYELQQQVKQ